MFWERRKFKHFIAAHSKLGGDCRPLQLGGDVGGDEIFSLSLTNEALDLAYQVRQL